MKNPRFHRKAGFTLIELLVVITIIAVLAGLSIPTMGLIQEKARETKASAGVHGLVAAIAGFQADYNRLPRVGPGSGGSEADAIVETDADSGIIKLLLGQDPTNNPKETAFYTSPMAKNEANGLISNGTGSYAVVDPWSAPGSHQYYHIILDYNGDHKLENPVKHETAKYGASFLAAQPPEIISDIAVYSEGNPKKSPSSRKAITSW